MVENLLRQRASEVTDFLASGRSESIPSAVLTSPVVNGLTETTRDLPGLHNREAKLGRRSSHPQRAEEALYPCLFLGTARSGM